MEPAPYLTDEVLSRLPLLPLPGGVFFPGTEISVEACERRLVRESLCTSRSMVASLIRPGREKVMEHPPVMATATAGSLVQAEERPDGRFDIVLWGTDRVRIVEEDARLGHLRRARCLRLREVRDESCLRLQERCLRSLALRVARVLPEAEEQILRVLEECEEGSGAVVDQLACRLVPDPRARQDLLEELHVSRRLERATREVAEVCLRIDPTCKPGCGHIN